MYAYTAAAIRVLSFVSRVCRVSTQPPRRNTSPVAMKCLPRLWRS